MFGMMSFEDILIQSGKLLGIQEIVNDALVPLRGKIFELG